MSLAARALLVRRINRTLAFKLAVTALVEDYENQMPQALLESYTTAPPEGVRYEEEVQEYSDRLRELSPFLIRDLEPGLKHHSIHVVSFTSCFRALTGFDIREFGRLLQALARKLQQIYPRSPLTLGPNETHSFASIRMRLFLTLYRLRLAASYEQMEAVFGWSTSILQEWFETVMTVLHSCMHRYHRGFLRFMGENWQRAQLHRWAQNLG